MFGIMAYVLIGAAALLAGAFAIDFLATEPGRITLDYNDRIYEVTLFEGAVILVSVIVAVMIALSVLRLIVATIQFIAGNERAFGGFFTRGRQRRGLDALSKGMMALEIGDAKTARKQAELAERKLKQPALTRLLNAQAAELTGEGSRATRYYKALMAEPKTAFVGARGLLTQAMEAGETDRALKLATHAHGLKPKEPGMLETLYELQSQKFDWAAARKTVALQLRAGHLPKPDATRREASLILAQSRDAEEVGEAEHARALAVEAAKMDPTNVEAVATAVGHLVAAGSKRAAGKLVQESWRHAPHPQLAAAYAEIEPDEAPAARRRRFEALFALHPDHVESRFLRAELALVAEDWGDARKAIESMGEIEPSARSCAIMAAIARGEGEPDQVVRGWLARALGAPRDDATDSQISHAAMLPLLIDPQVEDAEEAESELAGDGDANDVPSDAASDGEGVDEQTPPETSHGGPEEASVDQGAPDEAEARDTQKKPAEPVS
ncbi:MAG: heme biosynthesis HemY N-terminal domain-containing protein [Pseudomonadota bacterium]